VATEPLLLALVGIAPRLTHFALKTVSGIASHGFEALAGHLRKLVKLELEGLYFVPQKILTDLIAFNPNLEELCIADSMSITDETLAPCIGTLTKVCHAQLIHSPLATQLSLIVSHALCTWRCTWCSSNI
jgi:hypothetical protein